MARDWSGPNGSGKRCESFLTLVGHENCVLFELAYLELARAPYRKIERVGRNLSNQDLPSILQRREYIEWRPLAILMLSQSAAVTGVRSDHTQGEMPFSRTSPLSSNHTQTLSIAGRKGKDVAQKQLRSFTLNLRKLDHLSRTKKSRFAASVPRPMQISGLGAVSSRSGPRFCEVCIEANSLRR